MLFHHRIFFCPVSFFIFQQDRRLAPFFPLLLHAGFYRTLLGFSSFMFFLPTLAFFRVASGLFCLTLFAEAPSAFFSPLRSALYESKKALVFLSFPPPLPFP